VGLRSPDDVVRGLHHVLTGVIKGRPTANFGLFKTMNPPKATDPGLGPR
jgi:hypothetical protein